MEGFYVVYLRLDGRFLASSYYLQYFHVHKLRPDYFRPDELDAFAVPMTDSLWIDTQSVHPDEI